LRAPLARGIGVGSPPLEGRGGARGDCSIVLTTDRRGSGRRGLEFGPTASMERAGGQCPPPPPRGPRAGAGGWGRRRCVTPRQTCPRPDGLGRNLRSKTRWFAGFCNSHQVSHFATFFIDARAEISVAESRFESAKEGAAPRTRAVSAAAAEACPLVKFPWRGPRRGFVDPPTGAGQAPRLRWDGGGRPKSAHPPAGDCTSSRVVLLGRFRQ